jgi:SAM-dependent methyltransferase
MEPKKIVRDGYNTVSYAYRGDEEDESSRQYHAWLDELLPLLAGAFQRSGESISILDLGCGNGIPVARRLAKTCAVTGVDFSPVQIERARKLVPTATFLCQDMTTLSFEPASFEAILAFYSIIHVPLDEQPPLLGKIFTWLQPCGLFMTTLGSGEWTGTEENWLEAGGRMYWSHTDADTYHRWLAAAGFSVRWDRFIPEGQGGHTLFLCEKPG